MAGSILFCETFFSAGTFFSGSSRVLSLECNVKEGFTTVTAKVGAKQVDKVAKSALNNYINDMVYDILDNALDKPTGVTEKEEEIEEKDTYLQLSSQVSKLHLHIHIYMCFVIHIFATMVSENYLDLFIRSWLTACS